MTELSQLLAEFDVPDLPRRLDAVDELITATLTADNAALGPASLRVAGAGGKRLRPLLTLACAALGGATDDRVTDAAAAVELVQVGSLVHDDIFESAPTRRGTPTINAVEGESHALLAGDFILARAGALAARVSADAAALIGKTVTALCEGQLREMQELFDVTRSAESHFASIRGKTAALFECACRLGAMGGDLSTAEIEAAGAFGDRFGMAFQVLDDVLDVVADPARLGKPVGIDVATGVYTLPVIAALEGPSGRDLRRRLPAHQPDEVAAVLEIVRGSDGLSLALAHASAFADEAAGAAGGLPDTPLAATLAAFARRYQAWALEYFAPGVI